MERTQQDNVNSDRLTCSVDRWIEFYSTPQTGKKSSLFKLNTYIRTRKMKYVNIEN